MLAAFFLAAAALCAPSEGRDQAAVDAYRRGDFDTAANLWTAVLEDQGPLSSAERARILYDLGNAAYRKGNVVESVGWYTASLRLRPRDADTWKNLEYARATAKLEPADRGDLVSTAWRLFTSLTAGESRWLALAGVLLCGAALAAEALRGGRVLRRLAWLSGAVAIATALPWLYHRSQADRDTALVLEATDHGADVRSEPRSDATVVGNVASGEEVERRDELPGWVKVDLPGGNSGWIESRAVFPLKR
jgi:tetratricopeptide (TPR) repeat protein